MVKLSFVRKAVPQGAAFLICTQRRKVSKDAKEFNSEAALCSWWLSGKIFWYQIKL